MYLIPNPPLPSILAKIIPMESFAFQTEGAAGTPSAAVGLRRRRDGKEEPYSS